MGLSQDYKGGNQPSRAVQRDALVYCVTPTICQVGQISWQGIYRLLIEFISRAWQGRFCSRWRQIYFVMCLRLLEPFLSRETRSWSDCSGARLTLPPPSTLDMKQLLTNASDVWIFFLKSIAPRLEACACSLGIFIIFTAYLKALSMSVWYNPALDSLLSTQSVTGHPCVSAIETCLESFNRSWVWPLCFHKTSLDQFVPTVFVGLPSEWGDKKKKHVTNSQVKIAPLAWVGVLSTGATLRENVKIP